MICSSNAHKRSMKRIPHIFRSVGEYFKPSVLLCACSVCLLLSRIRLSSTRFSTRATRSQNVFCFASCCFAKISLKHKTRVPVKVPVEELKGPNTNESSWETFRRRYTGRNMRSEICEILSSRSGSVSTLQRRLNVYSSF